MSKARKLFGLFIFYSGYYYLVSFFRKIMGKREFVVLMYHRISEDDRLGCVVSCDVKSNIRNFEEQMRHLSKNYKVITFEELAEHYKNPGKLPRKTAIITFDDGYEDNYSLAYPILKKYNLPATIFLTTGHINKDKLFWWDGVAHIIAKTEVKKFELGGMGAFSLSSKEKVIQRIQKKLKRVDNNKRRSLIKQMEKKLEVDIPKAKNLFLSWDRIKEMSNNNISFGAHTVNHPILSRVSFNEAKDEILNSKNKIEKELNKEVSVFAYPNGTVEDMSKEIDEFLKENGFCFALSTIYGLNEIGVFRLKRIGMEPDDDLRLFRIKLLGIGESIATLYLKFLK